LKYSGSLKTRNLLIFRDAQNAPESATGTYLQHGFNVLTSIRPPEMPGPSGMPVKIQTSAIQVQRMLVNFVYFWYDPTNESLDSSLLLLLGFLALDSFHRRRVAALAQLSVSL